MCLLSLLSRHLPIHIQFSRKLNSEYSMEIQICICAMFNFALAAKYHARDLRFKVWCFRISILNKGNLACPVQPGATCATTNIEHKTSRNGVGKMFPSTRCSSWPFYSLLPMFLDSEESCLEMKYGTLSSLRQASVTSGTEHGPRMSVLQWRSCCCCSVKPCILMLPSLFCSRME